jgi:hypothetical protein
MANATAPTLLKHRRGHVPGDATLAEAVALRFAYTTAKAGTSEVPPEDITLEE